MKKMVYACVLASCIMGVIFLSGCTRLVAEISMATTSSDVNFAGRTDRSSCQRGAGVGQSTVVPFYSAQYDPKPPGSDTDLHEQGARRLSGALSRLLYVLVVFLFSYGNYEVIADVGNSKAATVPPAGTVIIEHN